MPTFMLRAFLILAVLISQAVSAWAADDPLSTQLQREEAGVIGDRLQMSFLDLLEQKKAEEEPEPIEEEKATDTISEETPFFVKEIRVENASLLDSEEIDRLTADYENKEQTLRSLRELTTHIERYYRSKGIFAYAYIPPQRLEGQVLTIQIIESKLGRLMIEGNQHFKTELLRGYFSELREGDILRYDLLKEGLKQANENPDHAMRAILKAGETTGTTDVILKVDERNPIHLGGSVDNFGNELSGEERYGFNVRHSNITGVDDSLVSGTVFGNDFGALFTQYTRPIPQWDAKWSLGYSYAQVAPKKSLQIFGVNGTSETYFTKIVKDFSVTDAHEIRGFINYEFSDNRTRVLSTTFSRTKLHIISFGPQLRFFDRGGLTDITSTFSQGIDWDSRLVTAASTARQGADTEFFLYQFDIKRLQRMPIRDHMLMAKAQFQIPASKLPSKELLSMGGGNSVRGYPEGDYLADSGIIVNLDYLMPIYGLPRDWKIPGSNSPLYKDLQLAFFLDLGYGETRGATTQEVPGRLLVGLGPGLQYRFNNNLSARVDFGFAVGNDPRSESKRNAIHFRFQYEF